MTETNDIDLLRCLSSALKAKTPFVGIPMPGQHPLIFRRDFLHAILHGVTLKNVQIIEPRWLLIEGIAGQHIRTRAKLNPIARFDMYRSTAFRNWCEAKTPKVIKPRNKQSKYDRAVAKVEQQLRFLKCDLTFTAKLEVIRLTKELMNLQELREIAASKSARGKTLCKPSSRSITAQQITVALSSMRNAKRVGER